MEAAGYDPLRAQQIMEEVTPEWWQYWLESRNARAEAMEKKK